MSRTVTLLRHAKSSRDDPRLSDFDRPLAERGRADAPRMSAWMNREGLAPDLVLCSTALRTRETLALVASGLPVKVKTRFEASLYHAEALRLMRTLHLLPDAARHVLIVGHNPGFHDVALHLIGVGDRDLRAALAEKFPTCGCAVLEFAVETWSQVSAKGGMLSHWMSPKRLP